ncbi:hypothetical protein ACTMTJ_14885 [Phytohabitans sp. LJ34]|uniref:hypothetical protein n=1 Tax=Phytohabitans sp. LJ34 TaxID=3452217 RepID=UPI003F88F036
MKAEPPDLLDRILGYPIAAGAVAAAVWAVVLLCTGEWKAAIADAFVAAYLGRAIPRIAPDVRDLLTMGRRRRRPKPG